MATSGVLSNRKGKKGVEHDNDDLHFYINGEKHTITNPDPSVLLVNYLRSTKVGLTGTKHACGQGGCGSCTVLLSYWDELQNKVVNVSCNSCLRPLVALDGMEVTTIEGLGSVNTEVSPVQYAIAKNNGTQCGYCTPGFVMNMHSLLLEHEGGELSKKEIEQSFDGNICRCTGFRPILYGMKKFATDWVPGDEEGTPDCYIDPSEEVKKYKDIRKVNKKHLAKKARALHYQGNGIDWYRPLQLEQVNEILNEHKNTKRIKLVGGNTSVGIPLVNPVDPEVMIDISMIQELKHIEIKERHITVGAATTYSELLDLLEKLINKATPSQLKGLNAVHYMAIRTAGKIVRNMATLAGNTMLVARNVKSGYPFPSDLFVALSALNSTITIATETTITELTLPQFIRRYNNDEAFSKYAIILKYNIPFTQENDFVQTYKVSLRLENSHSLANAGFKVSIDGPGPNSNITSANLIMGGITTHPVNAKDTQDFLIGKPFSLTTFTKALPILKKEIEDAIFNSPDFFKQLPSEGVSNSYKVMLLQGYFYKFFIEVLKEIDPAAVPPEISSATELAFVRPVSVGTQSYSSDIKEFPVNVPFIKLTAFEQATGEQIYTHDIPVPVKGLQGAYVTSVRSNAKFYYHLPLGNEKFKPAVIEKIIDHVKEKFAGVIDYFTYRDIPKGGLNGWNDPNVPDPMFCVDSVTCYGQCIGLLIAEEEQTALNVADYITTNCIGYVESDPILDIRASIKAGLLFPGHAQADDDNHIITKPASNIKWIIKKGTEGVLEPGIIYGNTILNGEECEIIAGTQQTGDQKHFYMETHSCFIEPGAKKQMKVISATQNADWVQTDISQTLLINENNIDLEVLSLGGGYGGKAQRTPYVAVPASLASYKLRRPVRVALSRETDSFMVGNRHPFLGEYNVAIVAKGPNKGKMMGTVYEFYADGGNTQDCSFDVMDCAVLGSDGAYNVPNFQTSGFVYKTNKSSNTGMRSYGGIQSAMIVEESIEAAAHKIGMLPEDVREKNLYVLGDFTPYGQQLSYCIMSDVWKRIRGKISNFDERIKKVQEFNKKNKWKKRGISMIPLKYGLGYNLGWLMQGGAHIDVYVNDGSVLVSHGGIEIGQGLSTKVAQVAAQSLNIPLKLIQMDITRTSIIPNAIGTGATSGSDLNCGAVREACKLQRAKLENLCMELLQANGSDWCKKEGLNYWDYPATGWQTTVTVINDLGVTQTGMIWNNILNQANQNRVELSSQALYRTPGMQDSKDQQFYGFTFSAACSEVEIDVLTGESNILRSDVLYDIGTSLNPAIDIGQVEGAFVMGIGNMLCEKLVWEPKGTTNPAGQLNTPNTWTYKPPCAASIPLDFRVDFFPREDAPEVPENPNLVMSSKGIGEPPLVLSNTVFFAIKHAILAARQDRGLTDWFEMDAPATVEDIRTKCVVDTTDL